MQDDPEDSVDFLKLISENAREANSFWSWRDKPIAEHGAALTILQAAGVQVTNLKCLDPGHDPPDCEGVLDGRQSGVEVTELVHRPVLERNIKAARQRLRGKAPERSEAYFAWDRNDLLAALQKLLSSKDAAKPRRSYERYVLVIHTDEFCLSREDVERFLTEATFKTKLITDAFFGLSYDPSIKAYPVFRLKLVRTEA